MNTEEKWTPIRETQLAKEIDPRHAGRLFRAAGFKCHKVWDPVERRQIRCVESRAASLGLVEVQGIQVFGGATMAVKKALAAPTYQDLVQALEEANRLIADLKEENYQLRSYLPNNGIGERARKALTAAGKAMTIYGG